MLSSLLLLSATLVSLIMEHGLSSIQEKVILVLDKPLTFVGWKAYLSNDPYDRLGPAPFVGEPLIFDIHEIQGDSDKSEELVKAYSRDGVVAIRGLIDDDLLAALDLEGARFVEEQKQRNLGKRRKQTQFFTNVHGAMFRNYDFDSKQYSSPALTNSFLRVALTSLVPKVAGEIVESTGGFGNQTERNLRVMRDIFIAKDDEQYVCGWHVDDIGFWPATPDAPGINAWIALDDMPTEFGGGFALAVGSHSNVTAPWRHDALYEIGATTTFPEEGYKSAQDMILRRTGGGTCNLKRGAPHLHRRMEDMKRVYPVKRGDVIFHDRWLFHRTVPFDTNYTNNEQASPPIYRRYSIRYSPGTATIPPGYGTELSVLHDEQNGGQTADKVCKQAPWYPQAWPKPLDREVAAMTELVKNMIPPAEEKQTEREREMNPLLQKLAQKQDRELARRYHSQKMNSR